MAMIELASRFNYDSGFCFEEDGGILVNDYLDLSSEDNRPKVSYRFRGSPSWSLYLADEAHLGIRGLYTIRDGNNNTPGGHWISPKIAGWQEWILSFEDRRDAQWFKLRWL